MQIERHPGIVLMGALTLAITACQWSDEGGRTASSSETSVDQSAEGMPQAPPSDTYTGALGRQQSGAEGVDPRQVAKASGDGKQFLTSAAEQGALEVQAARLALQKAASPQVRQFAKTMVENHSRVNDSLVQTAETKGVPIAMTLGTQGERLLKKLRDLDGVEFDRAYSEEMMETHEQTVRMFEEAAHTSLDGDVRAFAQAQLPTLRDHLRLAQTLPGAPKG